MTDANYSNIFYLVLGFSLFFGILGYYIGERGVTGVENDLNNVKLDVATIKGKIDGPAVVTPVGTTTGVVTIPVSNTTPTAA